MSSVLACAMFLYAMLDILTCYVAGMSVCVMLQVAVRMVKLRRGEDTVVTIRTTVRLTRLLSVTLGVVVLWCAMTWCMFHCDNGSPYSVVEHLTDLAFDALYTFCPVLLFTIV